MVAVVVAVAAGCADTTATHTETTHTEPDHTATTRTGTGAPSEPTPTSTTTTEDLVTPPSTAAIPDPTSIPTTTGAPTTVPRTTSDAGSGRYVVPVADVDAAAWGDTHSAYPATDIFVVGGCGAEIVSPVDGEFLEVRREDSWDEDVDDPSTRGGRSISILGDDGVRYYLAHFDAMEADIEVGARASVGQTLGTIGETGRTSACHLHFGISPPCPDPEWSVRRGVVWPHPYLNAWRDGDRRSPRDEVTSWSEANPNACAEAATS